MIFLPFSSLCFTFLSSSSLQNESTGYLSSSLQAGNCWTALMMAVREGHDTVIPLLLEADAQIDAQSNSGTTPLIWASANGEEAAVRELLKGNPNLDLKSSSGKTALDWAREKNHRSIVDLLVDHERS